MKKPAREVLADNLKKLRDAEGMAPGTWARVKKIDPKKEYRARVEPDVKIGATLQEIADKLRLEPWQLLHPDFDPSSLPAPTGLSTLAIDLGRSLDRITEPERRQSIYAMLLRVLREFQPESEPAHAARREVPAPSRPPNGVRSRSR